MKNTLKTRKPDLSNAIKSKHQTPQFTPGKTQRTTGASPCTRTLAVFGLWR